MNLNLSDLIQSGPLLVIEYGDCAEKLGRNVKHNYYSGVVASFLHCI